MEDHVGAAHSRMDALVGAKVAFDDLDLVDDVDQVGTVPGCEVVEDADGVATLEQRLDSHVELQRISIELGPVTRISGGPLTIRHRSRLDVAPLVHLDRFETTMTWREVLRRQGGRYAWIADAPDDLSAN